MRSLYSCVTVQGKGFFAHAIGSIPWSYAVATCAHTQQFHTIWSRLESYIARRLRVSAAVPVACRQCSTS
jgi:hypothetical protein